jgi:autotransporter-associated beta strand protein
MPSSGGTAGTVTINAPVTAHNLTFNTSGYTVARTLANTLTLAGATPTVSMASGISATISSVIAGTAGLTKAGLGTLTVSGANTYTGATAVNAGTLQAGATNTFAPTSAFTIASGATLGLNNFNQTIGSLAGAGTVTNGGAANRTLTTGGDNTSTAFSGVIQDGAAGNTNLTKGAPAHSRCRAPTLIPAPRRSAPGRYRSALAVPPAPPALATSPTTLR